MKIIRRIQPRTYLNDSLIWWDTNKFPDGKRFFTLAFFLFIIFIKIKIFPGFKIKINTIKL